MRHDLTTRILKRLNVKQTLFGEKIGFSMRTFRFLSGSELTEPQEQRISCHLHLEPSADIAQEQAADCTCYTEDECQGSSKQSDSVVGSNCNGEACYALS